MVWGQTTHTAPATECSKGPRISVALPVYNGEDYLAGTIASILAQTFRDFELIISDNASTDRTAAISQEFAARDRRIRYHRQPHNIGAAANFNRSHGLATGEYFKWAAHDDLLEPEYLAKCVAALDAEPHAVLCQTLVKIVEDEHRVLEVCRPIGPGADSSRPSVRLAARLRQKRCLDVFGVLRADALQVGLIRDHVRDPGERLRCYAHLLGSLRWRWNWVFLLLEPLMVLDPRVLSLAKSVKRSTGRALSRIRGKA